MTFSRNWVPLKSLSEQPATQSQGENSGQRKCTVFRCCEGTGCEYSAHCDWLQFQLVMAFSTVTPYELMGIYLSTHAVVREFFLSCKTGTLYPLNNSLSPPRPLVLVVPSILPRRLHAGRWRNSAPAISPSTQIPVCSRALSYSMAWNSVSLPTLNWGPSHS